MSSPALRQEFPPRGSAKDYPIFSFEKLLTPSVAPRVTIHLVKEPNASLQIGWDTAKQTTLNYVNHKQSLTI